MSADFIPRRDEAFLVWLKNLIAYLLTKITAWNIPQAEVNVLNRLANEFSKALAVVGNPATRTKVTVEEKNTARKVAESKARIVLKAYVTYNPAVTDADRDAMGIPIHKTTRSDVPIPETFVEAEIWLPGPAVVEIDFRDAGSKTKAKPFGVHGAEIAWALLDTPPASWKELIHSSFDTHTPLRLNFENEERGKTLYFALRWENTRGEKGPWSAIQNTVIP